MWTFASAQKSPIERLLLVLVLVLQVADSDSDSDSDGRWLNPTPWTWDVSRRKNPAIGSFQKENYWRGVNRE